MILITPQKILSKRIKDLYKLSVVLKDDGLKDFMTFLKKNIFKNKTKKCSKQKLDFHKNQKTSRNLQLQNVAGRVAIEIKINKEKTWKALQ